MHAADTIVAVATPPGRGGIGIVRVSGPHSRACAQQLLGMLPPPRYAHFGCFYDTAGAVIDEGVALWFEAPASFTGEDILELHAHGSPVVLDLLVEQVIAAGVRLAQPGEFSRRAFENGKYDLLQLEAVADLISSASRQAAQSAQRSLQGVFSTRVKQLQEQIVSLRVQIEAAIDFSDEEIDIIDSDAVRQQRADIQQQLDGLISAAETGARLCSGAEIVIAGRPNAGKSSLLNCLAGRSEAIVSNTAGTTRDLLKCDLVIAGMPLRVIDTAGLCEPQNEIEAEGIRRARAVMRTADLVIIVIDVTVGAGTMERQILAELSADEVPSLLVFNKTDLADMSAEEVNAVAVSAKTGSGLSEFNKCLHAMLGTAEGAESAVSARRRHLTALTEVAAALTRIQEQPASAVELVAEELRAIQKSLAALTGEFTNEDLLGAIFSEFCIGK